VVLQASANRILFASYPLKDVAGSPTGVDGGLRAPELVEISVTTAFALPSDPAQRSIVVRKYRPLDQSRVYASPSDIALNAGIGTYFEATAYLTVIVGEIDNGASQPVFGFILTNGRCAVPSEVGTVATADLPRVMAIVIEPVFTWQETSRDATAIEQFQATDEDGNAFSGIRVVAAIRAKTYQAERQESVDVC